MAAQARDILRSRPDAARVRDDWGAGVTNLDVAASPATAINGKRGQRTPRIPHLRGRMTS